MTDAGSAAPSVRRTATDWTAAAVCAVAVAAALDLWRRYAAHWTLLWTDLIHDRNAHLDTGLGFASDLVHLRPIDVLRDVHWTQVWGPLHDGLLVGLTEMLSGFSPRAAVLPSLAAYAITALLALTLTRRLLAGSSPLAANLGGGLAAALALTSPSARAFATDVMLESCGSALTLLALYAAVRAQQDDSLPAWRRLAWALAALFFLKYNYWLLVMVAVAPLYAVDVAAAVRSPRRIRDLPRLRSLLLWHGVPAAVWLVLPGKLASFVLYLWPGTNSGEFPTADRLAGVSYYASAAIAYYQAGPWSAALTAALALCALAAWAFSRRPAGAAVLVVFLAIAAITTLPHPNRKVRFLHSWYPVCYVLAGVGLGLVVDRRRGMLRVAYGTAAAVAVASQVIGLAAPPSAPEGGVQADRPAVFAITDAYLPDLDAAGRPAILSNIPLKFLARWTYMQRYGRSARPITELAGFDPARATVANVDVFGRWVASGAADLIVHVSVAPDSPWFVAVPGCDGLAQYESILASQPAVVLVTRRVVDAVTITIWKRKAVPG